MLNMEEIRFRNSLSSNDDLTIVSLSELVEKLNNDKYPYRRIFFFQIRFYGLSSSAGSPPSGFDNNKMMFMDTLHVVQQKMFQRLYVLQKISSLSSPIS
jgi:hypothetical protein